MTKFLGGVLAGVIVMSVMWTGVELYRDLNVRLSQVEGYIFMLDQMMGRGR